MELNKLSIHNLRNLDSVELEAGAGFNIFYGENGAGKTSILEAIHILSNGRSFRSTKIHPLIQHGKDKLLVTGTINNQRRISKLGVERSTNGLRARIDGKNVNSILSLSESLPTLVLHPGTFGFLSAEPAQRRAFMDWGVFYANPGFVNQWRIYQKALRQRNTALRRGLPPQDIEIWNKPMAEAGEYIHKARKQYLQELGDVLPGLLSRFAQNHQIDLTLKPGWPEGQGLAAQLDQTLERDRRLGFTHAGPHRGDMVVRFNSHEASSFASRGQLKLVTVLLKLAQGVLSVNSNRAPCVLLLDDLPAELDKHHFARVLEVVADLGLQSFISSITAINELPVNSVPGRLFHVKHGVIHEVV